MVLDLIKTYPLQVYLYVPYSATHTIDRLAANLTTIAVNPTNSINAPAGATHFRFINAIGVV
jgi:hypothetical protein